MCCCQACRRARGRDISILNLWQRLARHLRTRLISGLLVLVPLVITIVVVRVMYATLASFLIPMIRPFLRNLPGSVVSVAAVTASVLVIYSIGLVTRHWIGRLLLRVTEGLILTLPVVKTVYASAKQVVDTFSAGGMLSPDRFRFAVPPVTEGNGAA
jgi:uncharacterized membrane protein